jgi:hypothetical protein
MMIPNADRAAIDASKILGYLLSDTHPIGRFKAAFFGALGYSDENWTLLRDDLLMLARTAPAVAGKASPFGQIFQVDGKLIGPLGRSAEVRTVWIIKTSEDIPRFVTAYPR